MSSEKKTRAGSRQRGVVLIGFAALILLLHAELARFEPEPYGTLSIDSQDVELFSPVGGSPLLIFAIAALLFVGRGRTLAASLGSKPLYGVAVPALALGIGLGFWARYVEATELFVPALVLWLLGGAAWLGGRSALRAAAVPSLFLVFAYPIPAVVVNLLIWPLQLSAATSADLVLRATGFGSERFADIVVLDEHAFMVIETCSGMRMIETLVMAGALYSALFFRRRAQVVVLLLAAPVIGYVVNLLRVLSIIFNPYSEWGAVHETQGVVMLIAGVAMIAGLDHLLLRREERLGIEPERPPPVPAMEENWRSMRIAGLAALALVALAVQSAIEPWSPPKTRPVAAFDIPKEIEGHKARGRKLDRLFYGSVGISRWLHREYDFRGEPVAVQILVDDRLDRRGSLFSAKTAIPGAGLWAKSRDSVELADGRDVGRYVYAGRNRRELVYHWTEGMAGRFEEVARDVLVLDRGPFRRPGAALSIRLSTPLREEPDALVQANQRLLGFAQEMRSDHPEEHARAGKP